MAQLLNTKIKGDLIFKPSSLVEFLNKNNIGSIEIGNQKSLIYEDLRRPLGIISLKSNGDLLLYSGFNTDEIFKNSTNSIKINTYYFNKIMSAAFKYSSDVYINSEKKDELIFSSIKMGDSSNVSSKTAITLNSLTGQQILDAEIIINGETNIVSRNTENNSYFPNDLDDGGDLTNICPTGDSVILMNNQNKPLRNKEDFDIVRHFGSISQKSGISGSGIFFSNSYRIIPSSGSGKKLTYNPDTPFWKYTDCGDIISLPVGYLFFKSSVTNTNLDNIPYKDYRVKLENNTIELKGSNYNNSIIPSIRSSGTRAISDINPVIINPDDYTNIPGIINITTPFADYSYSEEQESKALTDYLDDSTTNYSYRKLNKNLLSKCTSIFDDNFRQVSTGYGNNNQLTKRIYGYIDTPVYVRRMDWIYSLYNKSIVSHYKFQDPLYNISSNGPNSTNDTALVPANSTTLWKTRNQDVQEITDWIAKYAITPLMNNVHLISVIISASSKAYSENNGTPLSKEELFRIHLPFKGTILSANVTPVGSVGLGSEHRGYLSDYSVLFDSVGNNEKDNKEVIDILRTPNAALDDEFLNEEYDDDPGFSLTVAMIPTNPDDPNLVY